MRVLLIGGTGFLGKNVVTRLAAFGHELRVLARSTSHLEGLPAGVEIARRRPRERGSSTRRRYTVYLLVRRPEELATTENHPSWTHMYRMMMVAQIGFALAYVF